MVCGFLEGTEGQEAWAKKHKKHLALTASGLPPVKTWLEKEQIADRVRAADPGWNG